ncbi:MAG: hypothetical protein DWH70_07095 [Planctomycetota bacterium]|nr:MAG: hypothetical protein DWH70_07095 [Planctomycetota bacterium]
MAFRPDPFWPSKGSNGGVAVGLPHRNYSVFKQTPINQWEEKGRIRMELRIRKVDEGGGGLTGTRVSEAKGPFPGGKRVGSWGRKRE